MPADVATVLEHLRCVGISMLWRIIELFDERQIDVSLDVAHRAGVSIPVPRPAKISRLVDDADIPEASLSQACAGEKTAETGAGNDDLGMLDDRRPSETRWRPGIAVEMRELPHRRDILRVSLLENSLVALAVIL